MSVIDYPAEDATRDAVLEWAARRLEDGPWVSDMAGLGARRKRDREAAAKRRQIAEEVRAECVHLLRAFIDRPRLSAQSILTEIAALDPDRDHTLFLARAWPLAWKGLVEIECRVICNSNQIPPPTRYRIALTDKGRAMVSASVEGEPR